MKPFPATSLDTAARVFVVSNTPYYLYKHLRADATVQRLTQELSAESIKRMLSLYSTKWSNRRESIVAIYSLLTALSFKPASDYLDFLKQYNAPGAQWVNHFRGMILSKPEISTTELRISQPRFNQDETISTAASQAVPIDMATPRSSSGGGA